MFRLCRSSRDRKPREVMSRAPCQLFRLATMSDALYPLASLAQIKSTPSREDGIPQELEDDLRAYGCKLIQEAGVLLKQYVCSNS